MKKQEKQMQEQEGHERELDQKREQDLVLLTRTLEDNKRERARVKSITDLKVRAILKKQQLELI